MVFMDFLRIELLLWLIKDLCVYVLDREHPMIRVHGKRKLPVVGETIKFIRLPFEKHANWDRGLVDEIRDVGGRALYLIARL